MLYEHRVHVNHPCASCLLYNANLGIGIISSIPYNQSKRKAQFTFSISIFRRFTENGPNYDFKTEVHTEPWFLCTITPLISIQDVIIVIIALLHFFYNPLDLLLSEERGEGGLGLGLG